VQELAARALANKRTPASTRLLLLETMARAPLDRLPASWVKELGRQLKEHDEKALRQAVATLRAFGVADFDETLLRLAKDEKRPADLRVAALAAAALRLKRVEPAVFLFLTKQLHKDEPPLVRLAAAEVLGGLHLDDAQLVALTEQVGQAGVLELPHLLAAYEHSKNGKVGSKLVAALARSPGRESLTAQAVRRALQNYPAEVQKAARPLLQRLEVDTAKQKARLLELKPVLAGGSARRGREVFFGKKAACAACHRVRAEGGQVGPDLSKIGAIRSGPDLLESIVFPSASFARGYEPYVIETRAGKTYNGIIARDTAEALYLKTAERAEIRIPRASIATLARSQVSIMPQGLDAQLSRRELGDLIAFLLSLK
jgi:putative heme-binding domain-containing protein